MLSVLVNQESRSVLGFSIVSFHEQVLGAHAYINRARTAVDIVRGYARMARILRQFAAAPVVPFDAGAAAVFDGLGPRRLRVDMMDLRIASIALAPGLTLLTRNTADFAAVADLITKDWTK